MNCKLLFASGIFHPDSGGPATYLRALLPELIARGWDVRVITYGTPDGTDYGYPVTKIPRQTLPLRMIDYARAARPLLQWADVIYQHTLALPLITLPTDTHKPRILKIVGDQAWERSIRKGWVSPDTDIDAFQKTRYTPIVSAQQIARAREVRRMDAVIVPSDYLRRMVVGWGVPEDRVQVIYNALPPDFAPAQMSQADARAALNLPTDVPLLLSVGRLVQWKGFDHLIAALAHVSDAHLLIAGDGELRPALEAQIAAGGLQQRVTLLGKVPHERIALYMKAADYVVLYSGYEGLSHTLLESLYAGTPVIASDKGGNPEVVAHGVNGLLVPYVNPDALVAALRDALAPGRRAALAANAAHGMERFTFANMIAQTDEALRRFV